MKMSRQYSVLDDRRIDQWKVGELKEELKRRNLPIKGLKDDLLKRLDESIRNERVGDKEEDAIGNDVDSGMEQGAVPKETDSYREEEVDEGDNVKPESHVKHEDVDAKPVLVVDVKREHGESETGQLDGDDDSDEKVNEGKIQDGETLVSNGSNEVVNQLTGAESIKVDTVDCQSREALVSDSLELLNNEFKVGKEDTQTPLVDSVLRISTPNNQVSEVSPTLGFQVTCDSISTSLSINVKNELKDNLNADDFHTKIETVMPEMVQPSSNDVPHSSGDVNPFDGNEPCEKEGSMVDGADTYGTIMDLSHKNDNTDGGYSEKLNLDRSSGDDSMEEDVLETKQIDPNDYFDEVRERSQLTEEHFVREGSSVNATGAGLSPHKKDMLAEKKSYIALPSEKRKLEDHEVVENSEPPKRHRKWNSERLKVPEQKSSNFSPLTTPKDDFQCTIHKRSFTRSISSLSGGETQKERVVPPSQKSPSNSLRIDNFLRPFTLKAVHELLAKTGTICIFWMDHIKTHCYVTFSSVEQAVETRNAIYNLQWPTNGGKLLVADFVDSHEVKVRADAPQSPGAPSRNSMAAPPAPSQLQPSPRQHVPKQQLPPAPPLPSSPSLKSDSSREQLPPPPPFRKEPDPPILTLDDLFRKTQASPRIYYLPLSEEKVAAKLAVQRRDTK